MTIRKKVAVLSPFISLAVVLASGCAADVAAKNVPTTATIPQTQDPAVITPVTTLTTTAPAESQPPAAQSIYAPIAPWDTLTPPVVADFTPAQLWADYKADPATAADRYYGKTYLFKNVVIEDMAMLYKPADAVAFVLNNLVYFRTDNKTSLLALKVGYVVDITGVVMGPLQNFVLVEHCSYTIVDTTNGVTRPDWVTIFE
jgi:hypothetical protein